MASSPKPPQPVDPTTIINAQEQANRVDRVTPFGNQEWQNGKLVTTLPQGTQNAFNNVSNLAGNQQQFMQTPSGANGLQNAILNKIANRYEGGGGGGQKGSQMQMPAVGQGGQPTPQAWNMALNQVWGGQQPMQQPMQQQSPGSPQLGNPGFTLPRVTQ